MEISLEDIAIARQIRKRPGSNSRANRKKTRLLKKKEMMPKVVVTGLGKIQDARQTLNQKKTIQDARVTIENKKTGGGFDARSKIASKQKSKEPTFDARQKILSKNKKQDTPFVPKVTITGFGGPKAAGPKITGPRGGSGEPGTFTDGFTFRRTIQNDAAPDVHIPDIHFKDLVVTTKQAVKRRPSPIRPPPTIATKQARLSPIRPQAGQTHQGNIIKLPRSSNTAPGKPQTQVVPQKKVSLQHSISQMSASASASGSPLQGFKLSITNLSSMVSHEDILELFGSLGAIKRARLIKPGQAEVVYVKKEDAQGAIAQYHLRELDGLPMNVVLVTPAPAPAPTPKPPAPPAPPAPVAVETPGPLRLCKGSGPPKKKLEIDPNVIHSALFKDKKHTKPVSFSITI